MLHYYNDLEILVFAYIMVILFLCAVSALVLYIRERYMERRLERLHRRAVFERIKRERDEAFRRLQRRERFERLQRDISGPTGDADKPSEPIEIAGLIREADNTIAFGELLKGRAYDL